MIKKEASADFDSLVKIISHDLRGPLGNIKNLIELFQSGDLEMKDATHFMKYMEEGVDRSMRLLDNLVEWGQSSHPSTSKYKEVSITETLREVCDALVEHFQSKDIQFVYDLKDSAPTYLNRGLIRIVTSNLLLNALSFTPSGGKVQLSMSESDAAFEVSVADSGIGIPEALRPHLFEIGKDSRRLGTNSEKGTGIGLFFSHDLLRKNNGKIWLDHSEEQKGSVFKFMVKKGMIQA